MRWITSGELDVSWSLKIDTLTSVMLVVVTTVSSLVHLYSIGYMHEDPSRPRFFAYLSLFTFAMLMLVTSGNLVQMFFGWEGVGLASYLLIGFWYKKPAANARCHQGIHRQPRRRFRLLARHLRPLLRLPHGESRRAVRGRAERRRQDVQLRRLRRRYPDDALAAAVRRRDGQVRAVPAAHVVAGRDGRPDARLRAHPCRDDGDGRRVHGRAPVADLRTGARMRSSS